MRQGEQSAPGDRLLPYLKAGHTAEMPQSVDHLPQMWASESDIAEYSVRAGDLVIAEGGDIGRTAVVPALGEPVLIEKSLHRIRAPHDSLRFIQYAIASVYGQGGFAEVANRSTLMHLTGEKLREIAIPSPPPRLRLRIATYLDSEIRRIDRLVEAKRQLRALLEERRRSTYRLSLNVEAPRVTLKHVATLGTGHTPSRNRPEYWVDCTIPWMSLADVWQIRDDRREVLTETAERISSLGLQNSTAVLQPAGTVLLSRTASVGFSAIMGTDMATTQDYVTWTCSERLRPAYLLYVLRASRDDLRALTMGSTHKTIYMPDIESVKVPLPPIEDQNRIVERIRAEVGWIDALTDRLNRQLGLLAEHRETLITAAVTGQIDVTREAPSPPEEALEPA